MKGTEKQIAWATDIKADAVPFINAALEYGLARVDGYRRWSEADRVMVKAAITEQANAAIANEDAKFWIETRGQYFLKNEQGYDSMVNHWIRKIRA